MIARAEVSPQPSLFAGADLVPGRWPFGALKPMHYGLIMADPAWRFENWSEKGEDRNASQHYATMTIEEIKALPVGALAAPDCALLLWCTGPFTDRFPEIMEAWGFAFKGKCFCWAKPNERACGVSIDDITSDAHWFMSTGYGSRKNTEDCWLGTIRAPARLAADVRELIIAPRREHSRKPDEAFERARRLYPGPHLELFSRTSRPGWDAWGNEAGKFDQQEGEGR